MAEAAQTKHSQLFSTGISHPRTLGAFSVFLFVAASIGLLLAGFVPYSTLAGMWPGTDLWVIVCLGLVFCLVHAITYTSIGSIAPRSGADYTLASRVLSAPLAFVSSLLFVVCSGLIAGLLVASISQVVVPVILKTVALIENLPALNSTATSLATSSTTVLLGSFLILLAFLSLILSARGTSWIFVGTLVLSVAAWGAVLYQIAFPTKNFVINWDAIVGSGTFNQQIENARTLGMAVVSGKSNLIIAGLFSSFFVFFGYFTPTLFASEVKQPSKNLLFGVIAALVVIGAFVIGGSVLINKLARPEWFAAQSYLSNESSVELAMPWVIFYANLVHPSAEIMWFVGAAWVLSLFNVIQIIFFYSSRVIATWAQDNILPASVGYEQPIFKSPIIALMFICLVAQVSLTLSALGQNLISTKGFVLATAISQVVPVVALIVFPFVKKSWFEKTSGVAHWKIGPLPVVSLMGSVSLVYLLAVIGVGFMPNSGIEYDRGGFIGLVALFVLGFGWYLFRRWDLRRSKQMIETRFAELPIED